MTKKIYPIELLKWLFIALIIAIILGYCLVWIMEILFGNLPDTMYRLVPLLPVTYIVIYMFFRLIAHLEPYRKPVTTGLQATSTRTIPLNQNGRPGNLMMHAVGTIFSKSESPEPEGQKGLDWWQVNNIMVTEDLAVEFYRKGWNRQLMGSNHPFSENWMTNQRFLNLGNTRMDSVVFQALKELTTEYKLWLRIPQQGRAGRIITNPGGCIARLTGKW